MYNFLRSLIAPSFDFSTDVFSVTCARVGVGDIAFIDLRIDGTDGWFVRTVTIDSGLQSITITCDLEVDSSLTERCGKAIDWHFAYPSTTCNIFLKW